MKTPALVALALGLSLLPIGASAADPIRIPLTPDRWSIQGGYGTATHNGVESLVVMNQAVLKNFSFRDGTIELDVDPVGMMGAGLNFRFRDNDTFESFYLRPDPKCTEAPYCVQYTPQTHGVLLWDLFPRYQAPAPVRERDWNHLKFVISGRRMNVYVNGAATPTLHVGRLEGDALEGTLVLHGAGFFANVVVTPDAVEGLAGEPEDDATAADRRYVRAWQLAPFTALANGREPQASELAPASAAWRPLMAERNGLLNISREYGIPLPRPERSLTWLKTTIHSAKAQTKQVNIGWVREVWVFVNGKRVYADKNLYQPPSARKEPEGRCALENGAFALPLQAGDNEVAVAIANSFYGWGLILRLNDLEGIRLTER